MNETRCPQCKARVLEVRAHIDGKTQQLHLERDPGRMVSVTQEVGTGGLIVQDSTCSYLVHACEPRRKKGRRAETVTD